MAINTVRVQQILSYATSESKASVRIRDEWRAEFKGRGRGGTHGVGGESADHDGREALVERARAVGVQELGEHVPDAAVLAFGRYTHTRSIYEYVTDYIIL